MSPGRRWRAPALGHELEDERGVDGGLLAGLEFAEAVDVVVEAVADFLEGGFFVERGGHKIKGRF